MADAITRYVYDGLEDVHEMYARRIQLIEAYYKQYPISQSERIPSHTSVDNVRPNLTNIDMLLGISTNPPPWALMRAPDYDPRRPFISFSQIAPALGTPEQQTSAIEKLQAVQCETQRDTADKITIINGMGAIKKLDDWKEYIYTHMAQFIPV